MSKVRFRIERRGLRLLQAVDGQRLYGKRMFRGAPGLSDRGLVPGNSQLD